VAALPESLTAALGAAVVIGYAAGVGFTVLVCRRVIGRDWKREIGLLRAPLAPLTIAAVAFPGFTVGSDLLATAVYTLVGMRDFQLEAGRGLSDLLGSFHWSFAVLAVGICPGVAEELWCRGFLGRGLVGRHGVVVGVALTSLFFGLLHLYPLPYVLITGIMGAALHLTYLASRSLWVPILIHTLNNSYAGLVASGVVSEPLAGALAARPAAVIGTTLAVLLAGGAAFWATRRDGQPGSLLWAIPPAGFSCILLWLLFT
jgi:membrane protease YdiL (CAAX protease family)